MRELLLRLAACGPEVAAQTKTTLDLCKEALGEVEPVEADEIPLSTGRVSFLILKLCLF